MSDAPESAAKRMIAMLRSATSALRTQRAARRQAAILVAAGLVCAYAIAVLAYVLATPEIGVRCAFTPVVNHFYEEFLFPAGQEPLREGDRIVRVAEQPVETWSQLLRRLALFRNVVPPEVPGLTRANLREQPEEIGFVALEGERLVRVAYERPGGQPGVAWCRLGTSPMETVAPSVLWFFLKLGLFVVGAIVYWKRPDDESAARFFWLVVVTFGAFMGGYHWSRIVTIPALLLVFMTCGVLLPAVTLHFHLLFPRPKAFYESHRKTTLLVVYGFPVFFLLLLLQGYLRVRWLDLRGGFLTGLEPSPGDTSGGVRLVLMEILYEIYAFFVVGLVWYLASVAALVHAYRTARTPVERNQVRWVLAGAALAVPPIGYSLYLALYDQGRFGAGGATWPMFFASAFVTVAYAVSITRYRLLQLGQIISSGAVYFFLSSFAGLLYYGLVFAGLLLVGSVSDGPSLWQFLGVAATAMLLLIGLDMVRGRLKRALDRHYRREKVQLDRTLQSMTQAIEQLVGPPTLGRKLLHTMTDLLGAPTGAVYLREGEPSIYKLVDHVGPPPGLAELSSGCPLIEAMRARETVGLEAAAPVARQLSLLGGTVGRALQHEGQLLGLLVLGPRPGAPYSVEELQVLAAFGQMTAPALAAAEGRLHIEQLNAELKAKVDKIAEQQRRILALQSQLMKREAPKESDAPAEAPAEPPGGLVGSGPRVQQLMHLVKRVAASSSAVLLRGESGTGKELLAKALHDGSPRAGKAFVKVHCAALSPGLLESELFGHVKGAFTTAIRDKAGRFEAADGGTLFLDEIGDINWEVQTKLLRVLEEMTFERVGSNEPVSVDVRVVAATHRDLEAMIAAGTFREDLYFRLNVLPVVVPPLRERAEDIPELVAHFLDLYARKVGKPIRGLDDDALVQLKGHTWPGNVRQLENVIERALVIAEGPTIGVADLPEEVRAPAPAKEPPRTMDRSGLSLPELATVIHADRTERDKREREQLVRALAAAGGNKAEAARALGVARSTLASRLKKLGLG